MTKATNLTYKELLVIAPKGKMFKIKVQHNPYGEGAEEELWACVGENGHIDTYFPYQGDIDGIDYCWDWQWEEDYKGTFDYLGEAKI